MSKAERYEKAREIELGSGLNTLSRTVFKAFAEKMLPLSYDPEAFYTVEQFKHIEKEKNILSAFARNLGLDAVEHNKVDSMLDQNKGVVSLKNEIVKELIKRGKLAKKGSYDEEEAKREAVKPILETLMVLDTVLKGYGGRAILHHVMPSQMPQPMISPIDLFSYAGGVCVCFLQALNEGNSNNTSARPLNLMMQQKAMEDAKESVENKVLSERTAEVLNTPGTLVDILGVGNYPSSSSSSSGHSSTTITSGLRHHHHVNYYVPSTSNSSTLSPTPSSNPSPSCCGRPSVQIVPPWSRRASGSRH